MATIVITAGHESWPYGTRGTRDVGLHRPVKMREWTAKIDRALRPAKPAKGYPRPVFDPEAEHQVPPTWTYQCHRPRGARP